MANIVDLDALVGGDLTFKYGGDSLKIPGDVSTQQVFEIFQAFSDLQKVTDEGDPQKLEEATKLIHDTLLKLFQVRQPEMQELPFGVRTLPIVIQEILKVLGVGVDLGDGEGDAGPPAPISTPRRTKKSSRTKAAQSRRSSGSRSS